MYKTDFIDAVAKKAQQKKEVARAIIEAALEVIRENAQKQEPLIITGFGSFVVKTRGPKTVTDFKTKQKKKLPASRALVFRASPKIRALVNGKSAEAEKPQKVEKVEKAVASSKKGK